MFDSNDVIILASSLMVIAWFRHLIAKVRESKIKRWLQFLQQRHSCVCGEAVVSWSPSFYAFKKTHPLYHSATLPTIAVKDSGVTHTRVLSEGMPDRLRALTTPPLHPSQKENRWPSPRRNVCYNSFHYTHVSNALTLTKNEFFKAFNSL